MEIKSKVCMYCKKVYFKPYGLSKKQWEKRIFCSKPCAATVIGPNHPRFRKNKTKKNEYISIHKWLRNHHPKTGKCIRCGGRNAVRGTSWAKKPGMKYEYKAENFEELCPKCHYRQDLGHRVEIPCENCKKMIYPRNDRHRFCSHKCQAAILRR